MNCMKCGRETQNEKVFCEDCLLEMEKYPVRAGSVVPVFRQYEIPVLKKAPKRHIPTVVQILLSNRNVFKFINQVTDLEFNNK